MASAAITVLGDNAVYENFFILNLHMEYGIYEELKSLSCTSTLLGHFEALQRTVFAR